MLYSDQNVNNSQANERHQAFVPEKEAPAYHAWALTGRLTAETTSEYASLPAISNKTLLLGDLGC